MFSSHSMGFTDLDFKVVGFEGEPDGAKRASLSFQEKSGVNFVSVLVDAKELATIEKAIHEHLADVATKDEARLRGAEEGGPA